MEKKVVVVHTGGTIFMHSTEKGLAPGGDIILPTPKYPELNPKIEVLDLFGNGGIDSSQMTLEHSKTLAEKIAQLQNDPSVTGIVVTHGTDTLAETALELSCFKELAQASSLDWRSNSFRCREF